MASAKLTALIVEDEKNIADILKFNIFFKVCLHDEGIVSFNTILFNNLFIFCLQLHYLCKITVNTTFDT